MIPAHTCCDGDRWPQHDDKAAAGIVVLLTNSQKKGCDYGSHSNHAATPVPKSVPVKGQVDLRKRRKLDLPAVWVLKKINKEQNSQTMTVLCSFTLRPFDATAAARFRIKGNAAVFLSLNWRRVGRREALTWLFDAAGQNNFSMCKKQN